MRTASAFHSFLKYNSTQLASPRHTIQPHPPTKHTRMYQGYGSLKPSLSPRKYYACICFKIAIIYTATNFFFFFFTETRSQEKLSYPDRQSYLFLKIETIYTATNYEDICKYTASTIAACHLQREENRWQVLQYFEAVWHRLRGLRLPVQVHCTAMCCTVA